MHISNYMLNPLIFYLIYSLFPYNVLCSDDSDSEDDETYWMYSFVTLASALFILLVFFIYRACHNCIEDERMSVRNRFRGSKGFDQAIVPGANPTYYQQQNETHQFEQGNYGANPQVVNPLEARYLDNKYPTSKNDIYQGTTNKI